MKNQYKLLLLSVVLLTSLAPHMSDVVGIAESDRDLSIDLLEEDIEHPSNVLLFENVNPFGEDLLEDILNENSINYVKYGDGKMGDIDFSQYDMVIVNGNDDQGNNFYENLGLYREKFETYVSMGGILKITLANQDKTNVITPTLPGNINSTWGKGNDVTINDSNHTLMNIPNKINLTDLQGWSSTYHRIFNEYDDETNIILTNTNDQPILVEKYIGNGVVVIGTLSFDHDLDHKPEYENFILYSDTLFEVENLPEIIEYNLGTADNIVFNITTSNATTYDILLNNEFINSHDYLDNDTITLDLNSIYSNYTFVNNDTNFEFSNLTLVFRNAQNDTYTVSINVVVFIILTTTETETEFSNSTDTETVTTTTNQVSTITETSKGNGNNTITEVSTLISTIINTVSENNGNSTNTLTENNNTPDFPSAFNNPNWLILVAAVGAAEIIRRRVS